MSRKYTRMYKVPSRGTASHQYVKAVLDYREAAKVKTFPLICRFQVR